MSERTVVGVNSFKGLTDLPLFGREPGWCSTLLNMRVRPGGYLEARAGFDAIKPSGGTAAAVGSSGIFVGGHEHIMSDGWILMADTGGTAFDAGTAYTAANFSQRAYLTLFDTGTGNSLPTTLNDAVYIGADGRFSRVVFEIGQDYGAAATPPTFAYEFWNGSSWGTLTLTATPDFSTTGTQTLEFDLPSTWTNTTVGNIRKYWIRIRISNTPNWTSGAAVIQSGTDENTAGVKIAVDWPGQKEVFAAVSDAADAANVGAVKRYDNNGTTAVWTALSSSLYSGNYSSVHFATYRNRLYFVNGKDQKRWDGHTLGNIGFTAPVITSTATATGGAGNFLGTGSWAYAMTYGYGPAGEWGESSVSYLGGATDTVVATSTTDGVNEKIQLDWTFTGGAPASGIVDVINIYRTQDLTSIPASAISTFPFYKIATLYRTAAGALKTQYTDSTIALPSPPKDLNVVDFTPPTNCKFIVTHKNRLFLGGNNKYPGRVWWSEPFELEAFDTDESFSDFTRSSGGQLTGMTEFNDQVVCFTEDQMFGIANVDQDIPSIYVIHPGVGCIAPDTVSVGEGVMMWLARDGIYIWDGDGLPQRASTDLFSTYSLSPEKLGRSRGVIHTQCYDLFFVAQDSTIASVTGLIGNRLRYDLVTKTWSTLTLADANDYWGPLAAASAPLGHAIQGIRRPLWGRSATGGNADYHLYVGEYLCQDDGANYTCGAVVHMGPQGTERYSPRKFYAIYKNGGSVWGSPTLVQGTTTPIGPNITEGTTLTATGTDYTMAMNPATNRVLGSGDVSISFSIATAAAGSGSERTQRILGLYMDTEVRERALGDGTAFS